MSLPGGGFAIVCSRGHRTPRCRWCERTPGTFQCDWRLTKTGAVAKRTCDKYLCATHATEVGQDKHLCPEHVTAFAKWRETHPEIA